LIDLLTEEHSKAKGDVLLAGFEKCVCSLDTREPFEVVIQKKRVAFDRGHPADKSPSEDEAWVVSFFEYFDVMADWIEPDPLKVSDTG